MYNNKTPNDNNTPEKHRKKLEGDIISLAARAPVVGKSILAELEQSWWSLAEDGVPCRKDINAAIMGSALSHSFIIERIAPGHARLRVAGRHISEAMGCEARGMPLSAMMSAGSRPVLAKQLENLFSGMIVEVPVEAIRRVAFGRVKGRLLLLPLQDDDGEITRAVGALVFDGVIKNAPVRCVIPEDAHMRNEPFRMVRAGLSTVEGGRRLPPRKTTAARAMLSLVVNNA